VLADEMAEESETLTITLDDTLNLGARSAYTLTLISADAQQGSVTIGTDNTLTYTPKTGFDGEDIITYTIDDGNKKI
jgi:hypothetical protein|tara:strand:- start:38 stop:268 length:231 start_codon:yes stop_codon:yes gene_type:complete